MTDQTELTRLKAEAEADAAWEAAREAAWEASDAAWAAYAAARRGQEVKHKCPDCKNEFIQPFRCVTCGAEKLYDATVATLQQQNDALRSQLDEARAELERERMRLAACGVVALANTPESAAKARAAYADYRSASCDDVARIVDKLMEAREADAAWVAERKARAAARAAAIINRGEK